MMKYGLKDRYCRTNEDCRIGRRRLEEKIKFRGRDSQQYVEDGQDKLKESGHVV
jgi:hypothetical protein